MVWIGEGNRFRLVITTRDLGVVRVPTSGIPL